MVGFYGAGQMVCDWSSFLRSFVMEVEDLSHLFVYNMWRFSFELGVCFGVISG